MEKSSLKVKVQLDLSRLVKYNPSRLEITTTHLRKNTMVEQNESTIYVLTTFPQDPQWPVLSSRTLYLDPDSNTLSESPCRIVVNSAENVNSLIAQCELLRQRDWSQHRTSPAKWERIN